LIDRNQAPETELWYAPPDSTDYEYLVHIYWRGLDKDGAVMKYIWTITDTIEAQEEKRWNPADRIEDYMRGRLTTRTDSVFSFTAYKNVGGIGLKKNRQAFHIAAIDDNGVIDPTPAAIEFVATIDKLPKIQFFTITDWTTDGQGNYVALDTVAYNPAQLDTAGMYKPFAIIYKGSTTNGRLMAYKWFPLTNVNLAGANVWTEDLTDNYRFFLNSDPEVVIPSGIFRFAAQCKDEANAESEVDAAGFTKGVCQIVVNFDPDTEIYSILNIYKVGGVTDTAQINFSDAIPDTVPYRSWITLYYRGWDNPRDKVLCDDDVNKCIRYLVRYHATSSRFHEINDDSHLLPSEGPQDTNPCGVVDSTSMNIGTVEYEIEVRSVDENGRKDGLPEFAMVGGQQKTALVHIVGNYDPTLDSLYLEDHLGKKIADSDTIKWRWSDVPHNLVPDDTSQFKFHYETTFTFNIKAFGHDNPKELDGSGVKTWRYSFTRLDPPGPDKQFGRANSWVQGPAVNQLNDQFKATFYHGRLDVDGNAIFTNPPSWIGVDNGTQNYAILYEMRVKGRDTGIGENFIQYVFLRRANLKSFLCPPDPNEPISERRLLNDYPTSRFGRWTQEKVFRFYLQLVP
jgi:hypothetical protein